MKETSLINRNVADLLHIAEAAAKEAGAYLLQKLGSAKIEHEKALHDDLLKCTKISDLIFGGHIEIERQKSWLAKNPEIGYVVESEGKINKCSVPLFQKGIHRNGTHTSARAGSHVRNWRPSR